MSLKNLPSPTDSELEILLVLWKEQPCTVRQINDRINMNRGENAKEVGYTTTLKFIQIMLEKGLVRRLVNDRVHSYSAVLEEEDAQKRLLKGFVNSTFRGSAGSLVMSALGSSETTQEELEEIKKLIAKLENKS